MATIDPQVLTNAMATAIGQAMAQNQANMVQALTNNMAGAVQQMMGQMAATMGSQANQMPNGGQGRSSPDRDGFLPAKDFRALTMYDGKEDKWVEWYTKFTGIIGEKSPVLLNALKWVAIQEDVVKVEDVVDYLTANEQDPDEVIDKIHNINQALKNRLVQGLDGPAFVVQGAVEGEGFETWRRVVRKYDPKTPTRGMQLMVRVMVPGRLKKGEDVGTAIAH